MCDYFLQRMDDDHGGYLSDIVRTGCHLTTDGDLEPLVDVDASWHLDDHLLSGSADVGDFGDPFAVDLQDSLLKPCSHFGEGEDGTTTSQLLQPPPPPPVKVAEQDLVEERPKVQYQISPLLICPMAGGVQISPHMATSAIKRRKSQARKVVCIPAPAAASNRPSGEVVPSDRWAWRKYGQKPIKGSPYPRGYYRCSSSKGCSARKQVERSRTDPNMLVITYTSEHNHPLPTQRNALAGSVRSHSSKSTANSTTKPPPPPTAAADDPISPDEEPLPEYSATSPLVNDPDHFDRSATGGDYRPMIPEANQADDFFSDLAELESDPMSLIFSKGFPDDSKADEAGDPLLAMFDWIESSS